LFDDLSCIHVTIHWVDSGVDTGKIIKQVRVPRLADDTIDSFEARIHEAEYNCTIKT